MSLEDGVQSHKKVFKVVLKTDSSDPVPPTDVTNALEVSDESDLVMDAIEMNDRNNVAGRTFSLRPDITGTVGGHAEISGDLISTNQALEPAIADTLRCASQDVDEESVISLVADAVNAVDGDVLTGGTSGATAIIKAIDGVNVFIELTSGTFEVAETVSTGTGDVGEVSSVSEKSFLMKPNSESKQTGSVFLWVDGKLKALRDAVCNVVFTMANSGGLCKFASSWMGKDDEDNWVDVANPTTSYAGNKPPVFKCSQMKFEWTDASGDHEYIPINTSIDFNLGQTSVFRMNTVDCTGIGNTRNSNRSETGGNFQIEEDEHANFNPVALQKANQVIKLSYRIGDGTSGRTVYVRSNITISSVGNSTADGFEMNDISYKCVDETDSDKEYYMVFY